MRQKRTLFSPFTVSGQPTFDVIYRHVSLEIHQTLTSFIALPKCIAAAVFYFPVKVVLAKKKRPNRSKVKVLTYYCFLSGEFQLSAVGWLQ